jgi:hypothetical protein
MDSRRAVALMRWAGRQMGWVEPRLSMGLKLMVLIAAEVASAIAATPAHACTLVRG